MATQPPNFGEMAPEELARRRLELYRQGIGLESLRRTLPEAQGIGEFQGSPRELDPEQVALDEEIARRQREQNAQAEAIVAAEAGQRQQAERRRAQEAVAAATGQPLPGAASAAPGASSAESTFVGPTLEQRGPLTKTIITSRREPDGRVVFQTEEVPEEFQGPTSYGPGVEAWRERALGENPMRAARTETFRGTPVSDVSPGFLVREGAGGFSPGRQVADVLQDRGRTGIADLSEEDLLQESPAVQDIIREAQHRDLARRAQTAGVEELGIRSRLGAAQAGLAEEELREVQDPEYAARKRFALYTVTRELLGPEKAQVIENKVAAAIAALRAAGSYSPELEEAIRAQVTFQETGDPAIVDRIRAATTGEVRRSETLASIGP